MIAAVLSSRSASKVTTGTTIVQDGKQLSTGEHSQKYPIEVSRGAWAWNGCSQGRSAVLSGCPRKFNGLITLQ